MRFAGKVVLVTGGSDGLGKGIAKAFLREGARVAISGRTREKLDAALKDLITVSGASPDAVLGIAADIGDSAAVTRMFVELLAKFGTLDILINNAARTPSDQDSSRARMEAMKLMTTPVPKHSLQVTSHMSDETWLAMLNTNLNGLFYCTREALKIMEAKACGKIVNIASVAGISGVSFHSPHYSASKGGMVAFTKSVGVEVIGGGINVNCIAAGGIATEAWEQIMAQGGEQLRAQLMQIVPAGRMGSIEEFASLALYLASEEAAYLVGQVISPNGGWVT
ncbi:SDR family NAD(P)-dependent oxidoreductase [Pseudomonas sp. N040]|uniref:SDR family NAD(P)-dependent oxidoreductase n=1 Tax=Pseudomonas sp. N040 TaxID=2785325 RepID=UPI0018A2E8C0|nr:SDR family NAD(P)-dependent oxidoreductase [Pseudomonas sp. N040]MBF7731178.1 SDR family oxidoreductase [Pseudomonas sp. N040]MBW7014821.1 SDR family oxidoreductase [Pseudomonas sp. N040]